MCALQRLLTPVRAVHPPARLLQNGGAIMSCDSEFTDWLGYRHEDLYNRPVAEIVANSAEFER